MAELLLKIEASSSYDDGDILCAFSNHRIRRCHAEVICNYRKAARNASGLILMSEVARDWFENTHQYRFERVSATEITRTNLLTLQTETFGPTPNAKGEYIDVRQFIARRKRRPEHYLFGEDGAEIWYGGAVDSSPAKLSAVWNAITAKTGANPNQPEFRRWPMGRLDVQSHLPVQTDDFSEAVRWELESPDIDNTDPANPVVISKRKHSVDWINVLELTSADIARARDRGQAFDIRERKAFSRAVIVTRKQRR